MMIYERKSARSFWVCDAALNYGVMKNSVETQRVNEIFHSIYSALEPREVWRHFAMLNAIPRISGREAQARDYVLNVANAAGAESVVDGAGNVIVRAAGTCGDENTPIVTLQSHLDMVAEKRSDITHDWENDPILPRRDGGKIYGSGTTLGADNGIGAAMMLAVLSSPELQHGPLELLWTVQEEIGLIGAQGLDASLLRGDLLLNLDTEDPNEIIIGCAGGRDLTLHCPLERQALPPNWTTYEVTIGGLAGGHSGIQITEKLANAIKLLADALQIGSEISDWRLIAISGGNARNAIPRDARAMIALPQNGVAAWQNALAAHGKYLQEQWQPHETPTLQFQVTETTNVPLAAQSTQNIVALLRVLPHGVLQWSVVVGGKPQTSCNLATIETIDNAIEIYLSGRSFIDSDLENWQNNICAQAALYSAQCQDKGGYPGWEPQVNSSLLTIAARVYQNVYARQPQIEIVHAGLECGLILSKCPQMQAISFGPLIRAPHTPEEYVEIESVEESWQFLLALLKDLAA